LRQTAAKGTETPGSRGLNEARLPGDFDIRSKHQTINKTKQYMEVRKWLQKYLHPSKVKF